MNNILTHRYKMELKLETKRESANYFKLMANTPQIGAHLVVPQQLRLTGPGIPFPCTIESATTDSHNSDDENDNDDDNGEEA